MKFFKITYLTNRLYYALLAVIIAFICSYFFPSLYKASWLLLYVLIGFLVFDLGLLYTQKNGLIAERKTPEKLSNGDDNQIHITLKNKYSFTIDTISIDEIPFQFQIRDFTIQRTLKPNQKDNFAYTLRPVERGEYHFGRLNVYVSSPLGLIAKRYIFDKNTTLKTYPSFVQMQKYDLMAFSKHLMHYGLKKIRRIGHTMEFEQIKEYVQGDDIRTINWKATAKKKQLMVNQFQDEKSQPVYMIIDKGRTMKMPFEGLSLLDYSINASLALANIILKKNDKAGVFTFSKKVENRIVAERRQSQLHLILENLYNINTNFYESDFSRLYVDVKKHINQRSLLLLFTNFETLDALHRQLPYLKGLAKNHLLVVIFFYNSELEVLIHKKTENIQEIYDQVIAEKFTHEKRLIVSELKKYGIQSVVTKPENLTLNTINKYLEIKARGMI